MPLELYDSVCQCDAATAPSCVCVCVCGSRFGVGGVGCASWLGATTRALIHQAELSLGRALIGPCQWSGRWRSLSGQDRRFGSVWATKCLCPRTCVHAQTHTHTHNKILLPQQIAQTRLFIKGRACVLSRGGITTPAALGVDTATYHLTNRPFALIESHVYKHKKPRPPTTVQGE